MKFSSFSTAFLCAAILLPVTPQSEAQLPFFRRNKEKEAPTGVALKEIDAAALTLMQEGRDMEADGNLRGAGSRYKRILRDFPLSNLAPRAQFALAELDYASGDISDAFDGYQVLIDGYKQSSDFKTAVGRQYEIAEAARAGHKTSFIGIPTKIQSARQIEMYERVIGNAPYGAYAPKAQFAIAEIHRAQGRGNEAVAAYDKVIENYPRSKEATEAQYASGQVNQIAADRSEDARSINEARSSMQSFVLSNPENQKAGEARAAIGELEERQAFQAFEVARFYEKSGKLRAAGIYYTEVMKYPGTTPYDEARKRIEAIRAQDPDIVNLPAPPKMAKPTTKVRPDYVGPPAPDLDKLLVNPTSRMSAADVAPLPIEESPLPQGSESGVGNILLPPPSPSSTGDNFPELKSETELKELPKPSVPSVPAVRASDLEKPSDEKAIEEEAVKPLPVDPPVPPRPE